MSHVGSDQLSVAKRQMQLSMAAHECHTFVVERSESSRCNRACICDHNLVSSILFFHDLGFYHAPLQVGTLSVRWWDLRAVQSFMRACCSVGPYLDVRARFEMQSLCTFQLHVLICFETIVNQMLHVHGGLS